MAGISLLSLILSSSDAGGASGAAVSGAGGADAANPFAAMLASAGKSVSGPAGADTDDSPASDLDAIKDRASDADTDADAHVGADKGHDPALPPDALASSMAALLGMALPIVPQVRDAAGRAVPLPAGAPLATVTMGVAASVVQNPPVQQGEPAARPQQAETADPLTLAPALAALADSIGKAGAYGGGKADASAVQGNAAVPGAVAQSVASIPQQQVPLPPIGMPVAPGVQIATPAPAPASPLPGATPSIPGTAALLAARGASGPTREGALSPATETAPPKRTHEDDPDVPSGDLRNVASSSSITAPAIRQTSFDVSAGAGQQLAAGVADRQLDLARQGAWLDGVARDIAATGDSSGTLRFQVAPQHLGTVSVEMRRGDEGSAVTITASSEMARDMLSDAKPQLIAEARSHGLHIANAQVDVGTGNAGSGGNSSGDQHGRQPSGQPEGRHAAPGDSGFSAQTGGSDAGRHSQTRSQLLPEHQPGMTRTDRGEAGEVGVSGAEPSAGRADARYA